MTRGYAAAREFDQVGNPEALAVVDGVMEALALPLSASIPPPYEVRWFSSTGSVVVRGTRSSVFLSDLLLGEFAEDDRDRGRRNVLAVTLAKADIHLGRLAAAFGIGEEYLRRLRRKEEVGGPAAVLLARQGKAKIKVRPEQRASWSAQFEAGLMPIAVFREQPRRGRLSYATVWRVYQQWQSERATRREPTPPAGPIVSSPSGQLTFWSVAPPLADEVDDQVTSDESGATITPMTARPVRSGLVVQHVGSWLMLALAGELGLHAEAVRALGGRDTAALRIALDAIVCALAIGQRCVEGVRRLATPTGPTLLRAERVPTASGVRLLLGRLLKQTGGTVSLDACMTERLIKTARADDGPAVFYVDNHLRPYTGKQVVRKGWRMQDRRVLPGTSDYYVHDEDGRPLLRVAVPSHDSLPAWLVPLGTRLRDALGGERILLAFDRAGAFAEPLAALRDAGFDCVTYERKPYPALPATAFAPTVIAGEAVGIHETRLRNLGAGRGRVRRIAVQTDDGRQVNFLAVSTLPAERLVEILWNRWRQENGFKHGVERWGINQLDGRSVEEYPPGTIIPNPARRRLERALRVARVAEGDARRQLAHRSAGDARRERFEEDLAEALARQVDLEAIRPWIPTHAAVEDTELANTLVRHQVEYKAVIDVIRIVCANAESDLAALLAPHLRRPREAKKVVANLLTAPGKVAVTDHAIHIRLAPAANRSERLAIRRLLEAVNQRKLTLPGDPKRLPLSFELQLS